MRKFICLLALMAFCCGCAIPRSGSRVVVGEETALPEISNTDGTLTVRVFESIKGAYVATADEAKMRVSYSNTCTNTYFGIVSVIDTMALDLTIDPVKKTETAPKTADN